MKEFLLIIVMLVAGDKPNLTQRMPVASLEECYAAAKSWLEHPITDDMKAHDVVGLGATCAWHEKEKPGDPT
jgi:hypothetical protein